MCTYFVYWTKKLTLAKLIFTGRNFVKTYLCEGSAKSQDMLLTSFPTTMLWNKCVGIHE
jgi:hypothetical protein